MEIETADEMTWQLRLISQLLSEKKDSVDKLLHLINNDMSLIVGSYAHIFAQCSAPALDGMSAPNDYEF